MDINNAISQRRTIHSFNSRQVPEEYIERSIYLANFAPCHRLTFPWRFINIKRKTRDLLFEKDIDKLSDDSLTDENIKSKIITKIINPSHLLVASQILSHNENVRKEDYAACSCAIQNLCLSLTSDGVGSKWSTGKITKDFNTYTILGINPKEEEIIGFIWVGYGQIPSSIHRPSIESIFRRI